VKDELQRGEMPWAPERGRSGASGLRVPLPNRPTDTQGAWSQAIVNVRRICGECSGKTPAGYGGELVRGQQLTRVVSIIDIGGSINRKTGGSPGVSMIGSGLAHYPMIQVTAAPDFFPRQ
jgi:hypothetical protein